MDSLFSSPLLLPEDYGEELERSGEDGTGVAFVNRGVDPRSIP